MDVEGGGVEAGHHSEGGTGEHQHGGGGEGSARGEEDRTYPVEGRSQVAENKRDVGETQESCAWLELGLTWRLC